MQNASVLLVERDPERRRSLGFGLTAEGYEVVPTVDEAEAVRFADALAPSVVVAPAALAAGPIAVIGSRSGPDAPTMLYLGDDEEEAESLPSEALFVATAGLDDARLVRRIRLALVALQVGVEPDYDLKALVGDFAHTPPLDLVRRLREAGASGRVSLEGGGLVLRDGEVIAASVGPVRGVKAFCRLARRVDGAFRVELGDDGLPPREMLEEFDSLVAAAIEDAVGELPEPRSRYEVRLGPSLFSQPFSTLQQQILGEIHGGARAGELLDSIPVPDSRVARELEELVARGVLARTEALPAVTVITDSTADLPAELVRAHQIEMVPLTVLFGETRYVDREELEPARFYELLERGEEHPSTRPPEPSRFAFEFHRRLQRQDVVSVHISEKMSQTVVHARQAASDPAMRELTRLTGETPRIEVVDSGQVSLPLGLLALFAARLAERDLDAVEIGRRLREIGGRITTLFVVDTLEYLARGGRIGKAKAWLGGLMGIKPILGVQEGEVVPVSRVRGRRAALPRLIELAGERLDAERPVLGGIAHANAPARADRLRELLVERFSVAELYVTEMGPVVGTHVGPGCVGATLFQPDSEELELLGPRPGAAASA